MATTENGSIIEFYRDAVQNNFKSAEAGRPIYDEKDFIRITTPGDTRTVVVEPVNNLHQRQYPKAWEAYSKGMDEIQEGTPISQWNQASLSQGKELAHFNVRTVEQLSEVSDGNLQRMGPGYQALRTRAKQYLKSSKDGADDTKVMRENEQLQEENALLKEQIQALQAAAPKRGRPAKETE